MKLAQILDVSFERAIQELSHKDMSVDKAYAIADVLEAIKSEKEKFQKFRIKLLNKYGKKDENGQLVENKELQQYELADAEGFHKEYNKLLELNVKLPTLEKDVLDGLSVSPATIIALSGLFKNDKKRS